MKRRIAICHACSAIANGVKSRIALRHTCGKEPAQPKAEYCLPTEGRNQYAPLQTPIDEELDRMEKEIDPEVFDRISSMTERKFQMEYGYKFERNKL